MLPLDVLPRREAGRPEGPGCGLPAAGSISLAIRLSGITSADQTAHTQTY